MFFDICKLRHNNVLFNCLKETRVINFQTYNLTITNTFILDLNKKHFWYTLECKFLKDVLLINQTQCAVMQNFV